jgi:hypothetical protein
VDILVAALRGGGAMDWALFSALQHLTGAELGRDPALWRAWWPRVRETYFAEPPPAPAGGAPAFSR